jgi:hypothetical protein
MGVLFATPTSGIESLRFNSGILFWRGCISNRKCLSK